MAFPEPARTPVAANITVVRSQMGSLSQLVSVTSIQVRQRLWGDDDELYDHNSDGIPDFPLRANMRYARERRRRTINKVTVMHSIDPSMTESVDPGIHSVPGRRIWAGIGGFLFIPSFPQLRRKETIWPDAT